MWDWITGRYDKGEPEDELPEWEQDVLRRIEEMHSAAEQRDEFRRYVAKHAAKPRKRRWWQRRKGA